MIELITATPGSGKTLFALKHIKERMDKENRQVYYHGIELLIDLGWIHLDDPKQWNRLPDGAVIVVDECHDYFPPRKSGAETPEYISELKTHRHHGYDLFLITQHPTFVDAFVRRLVGRHTHLVRLFGAQAAQKYIWHDSCVDNPNTRSARKNCLDQEKFIYPRDVYKWYKSSQLHTHKFRLPKKVYYFGIALLVMILLITFAVKRVMLMGKKPDKESVTQSVPGNALGSLAGPDHVTVEQYKKLREPRLPHDPGSAPIYDAVAVPVSFPKISACIASKRKCNCYTQQGNIVPEVDDYRCRYMVEKSWFDPYRPEEGIAQAPPRDEVRRPEEPKVAMNDSPAAPASQVRSAPAYRGHEIVSRDSIEGRQPFGGGFKSMVDG